MNKRIRQLVEKSYIYDRQNDSSFFDKEKFAELIVEECTKILADNSEFRSCLIIAKHFGVEL